MLKFISLRDPADPSPSTWYGLNVLLCFLLFGYVGRLVGKTCRELRGSRRGLGPRRCPVGGWQGTRMHALGRRVSVVLLQPS